MYSFVTNGSGIRNTAWPNPYFPVERGYFAGVSTCPARPERAVEGKTPPPVGSQAFQAQAQGRERVSVAPVQREGARQAVGAAVRRVQAKPQLGHLVLEPREADHHPLAGRVASVKEQPVLSLGRKAHHS